MNIMDRLWRMVEKTNGCWLWTGCRVTRKERHDYGQILDTSKGRKRAVLVHRVVYENCVGPIPEGLHVLHRCDTPSCVRPDHLTLGTNADNVADKVKKGRSVDLAVRGESHGNAKLSDADVLAMRGEYAAGGVTQTALARKYGVAQTVVSLVVRGRAWPHIGGPRRRAFDRKPFVPHRFSHGANP